MGVFTFGPLYEVLKWTAHHMELTFFFFDTFDLFNFCHIGILASMIASMANLILHVLYNSTQLFSTTCSSRTVVLHTSIAYRSNLCSRSALTHVLVTEEQS